MSRVILESGKVADVMAMYGADNTSSTDGNIRLVRLGANGEVIIDKVDAVVDKAVNESNAFKADYTAAVATNATLNMIFTTDTSTKYTHLELEIYAAQGNVDVKLYEGVSRSEATTVTVYNRDRTSSVTSATLVAHTATAVTVTSTILVATNIPSTEPLKIPSFKLNVSKIYYLLLTPTGAGTNNISIHARWVDHTDWS